MDHERFFRPLALLVACALLGSYAGSAHAEDEDKARLLFQQGRQLLGAGQIDAACDAFQQSTQEYSGSSGSWLNLALCREKQGKLASAWSAYRQAAEVSEQGGDARKAAAARQLAVGLEPKLSRITISVPQRVLGQLVQLDGSALTNEEWGKALPVDPGEHSVSVSAPRYEDWSTKVQVDGPRGRATVVVPKLAPLPGMAPEPGQEGESLEGTSGEGDGDGADGAGATDGDAMTAAGIGLFVTAGVAVAVGAALGITALALQSDYEDEPTEDKADTGDQVTLSADVAFIVGIAAAAAGLVVVLVGDGDEAAAPDGDAQEPSAEAAWQLRIAPVGPGGLPGLTASWIF